MSNMETPDAKVKRPPVLGSQRKGKQQRALDQYTVPLGGALGSRSGTT